MLRAMTRALLAWSAARTATVIPATAHRMPWDLLAVVGVCRVFAMCIRLYSPERFSLAPICAFSLLSVRGQLPEVNGALSLSFGPGELGLPWPGIRPGLLGPVF